MKKDDIELVTIPTMNEVTRDIEELLIVCLSSGLENVMLFLVEVSTDGFEMNAQFNFATFSRRLINK